MDPPRNRWFMVFGVLLLVGVVLLIARPWTTKTTEPAAAPASAATTRAVEPKPEAVAASEVEAAAIEAKPASAGTGGTFRGRIIDAVTRRPVGKFEVALIPVQRGSGEYKEQAPLTQTFQSSSGRFAWNDVHPSAWIASVAAPGYRRFDLEEFTIEAGKTTPEVVMPLLRGFNVRGRVVDMHNGAGIGEAFVRFRDPGTHWRFDDLNGSTKSKQDGSFELHGVPGGDITLFASAKDYAPREVQVFVNDETESVDIALSAGGAISGRVVTSSGAPVKGTIMLTGPSVPTGGPMTEEGEFSFGSLAAGTYTLSASTPAGNAKERIELSTGERRSDVMLTIAEGRTVRGTIRGLRADQLRETSISSRSQTNQQAFSAQPDEQGAYVLHGVPPGRASLTVHSRSRMIQKWIDVPADRDLVFDVVFPPGSRLSGRVTQDGQPAAGKGIMMQPAGPLTFTLFQARTSEDGQYEIEGVPAGEYRLRADEDVSRSITIASDTVLNIDIPSVQVGGRVVEEEGAVPIVGADVHIRGVDAETRQVRGHKKSDHFGEFKLTGVETGDIQLTVYKPGYDMHREKIPYSSPITNKVIRLRRGGGVEIRVQRSAKGEPADGLLVFERGQANQPNVSYWIPLDRNGVGFLPSALTGSMLMIGNPGQQSIVIRQWDGSSLDLKF